MYISRRGIMTDGGVPCSLHGDIDVAVGQQASFTGYKKLAKRTAVAGECNLCGAGEKAIGVFVDCSPKGNTGTVETKGFVEVVATSHGYTIGTAGQIMKAGAGGILVACATPDTPTLAELTAGCWQVDEVIDANTVLIQIDARL